MKARVDMPYKGYDSYWFGQSAIKTSGPLLVLCFSLVIKFVVWGITKYLRRVHEISPSLNWVIFAS